MKIFDKASWQIDNGISKKAVVDHFTFIFEWLNKHDMLSLDGAEVLDVGIGEDVSLHEGLVNERGLAFLNKFYDKLIAESAYNVDYEKKLIESLLDE